jgi:(1->4)-alpha-D-glucan 1-alpha-D-glucosylmutase
LREGKERSDWNEPDQAYEAAAAGFLKGALDPARSRAFLESLSAFVDRLAPAAAANALAQLVLKLTAPGVPDIYQGDELVALSLVDPDNRRAVDWARRRELLDAVQRGDAQPSRDAEKLSLIVEALALRRERADAFAGAYEPVDAGPDVCAYVRGGEVLAVAVLRDAGLDATVEVPWEGPRTVRDLTGGRSYALLARAR